MADLEERYKGLIKITYTLTIILLILLILFILGFYKGWFGEPGKIYLSPDSDEYYVRCAGNPSICGELGECQKALIQHEAGKFEDYICVK